MTGASGGAETEQDIPIGALPAVQDPKGAVFTMSDLGSRPR